MSTGKQTMLHKQIRAFLLIWTLITFTMGLATFLAIYFTYSPNIELSRSTQGDVAITIQEETHTINEAANRESIVLSEASPESVAINAAADNFQPTATSAPTNTPVQPTPTAVEPPTNPEITGIKKTNKQLTFALDDADTPAIENRAFQVGIQVQESLDFNPENQDGWMRSVSQDLKLTWVKQQVRWEFIEKQPGQYDWSVLDLVMSSIQKFNLNILLSIVTAPDWSREQNVNLDQHGPPANPQDYVNFVLAILDRYPGQIQAIEVWNEQNISREWTSSRGLQAEDYVTLLRATYEAVKAVDPNIIVVSGALSPTGVNDGVGAWDDFVYLEELIQAGMLNYTDCVGAHHNGYNISPSVQFNAVPSDPTASFRGPFDNPHHSWSFRSTLEGYATRIRNAGSDIKLCVTEFGWPTTEDLAGTPPGFEFAADNTLQEQATWLPEAMSLMEEWEFVWLAFIWNFNYGPQAGYAPDNDNVPYSLIGPDFAFRPAYDAIRDWQENYLERLK